MKKSILSATVLLVASVSANAQTLEIINNYDQALTYTIQINPQYVPNFPATFTIEPGQSLTTPVLKSGTECNTSPYNPVSYISVADSENTGVSAFFATGLMCDDDNMVEVSGFMNHNLAYSWKNAENAVVVFCNPKNYPCQP